MHTIEQFKRYEQEFAEKGYFVLDLNNPELVEEASIALDKHLKEITQNNQITLENYHQFFQDDASHYDMQYQMLQFFREKEFAQKIILANIAAYQFILGPDLDIQVAPYLRITRPHKPKDNIGYHRDTFYGTGPGEISTVIPFVNLSKDNTLSVIPKSHVIPDRFFKTTQTVSTEITKDSKRHQMGFLYAPKVLEPSVRNDVVPIPLKKGQALVFMLSIIHGSEVNKTETPRWSTDIRVRNSLTPLNETMKANYYKSLKTSATAQAFQSWSN